MNREPAEVSREAWLRLARWGALAVFVALPVFAALAQPLAGRVVWTVCVASLPLLIVLAGYYRWRQICPLAWFAQAATFLGRPGGRRASRWLQANYYYVTFTILFVCLWLRLVAINGQGKALGVFLLLLSLAAFVFGAAYTGKTWCNYICPVSFVEKVYTEPRGLRETPNSQCAKCTACKPACPDINEENGYWKEIRLRPKRFVYFAFPGLVFAFYFYFYLQSGTWEYYFSGKWTNEPNLLRSAFQPGYDQATAGFFFLPAAPRAAAAFLTLLLGTLLSYRLFSQIERHVGGRFRRHGAGMDEAGVRHLMFTVAAFVAFVTFYTFAGAPTLRLIPGATRLIQILVVAVATLFLARRFTRRHGAFTEETLARQIIRRWEWADMKPPKDLHEAYLIHTIRSQTHASGHARLLEIYKEAVREVLASGFVSRAEVQHLESLRNQLRISPADHEKITADLDEEERARIASPALEFSAEKRLQLKSYSRALEDYLEGVAEAASAPDDSFLRHLRREYAVTLEEHGAVLADLLGKGRGIAPHVAEAFNTIEGASHTIRLLGAAPSAAGAFLADALARRRERAVDGLIQGFGSAPDEESNRAVREGLLSDDETRRDAAVEALGESVTQAIAERLREARRSAAHQAAARETLVESVSSHLVSASPSVRVAALYLLAECAPVEADLLDTLIRDSSELVRETALCLKARMGHPESRAETGLTTVEKMIALRSVPLFAALAPEDLLTLARAGMETSFAPGAALCREGEPGDEVFILLSGDVQVLRGDAGEQRLVGSEKAGGFIGEMAVLDSTPRAATVLAGKEGTRVLCLQGRAFREALGANPSVAEGVIRALAARIRGPQAPRRTSEKIVSVDSGVANHQG